MWEHPTYPVTVFLTAYLLPLFTQYTAALTKPSNGLHLAKQRMSNMLRGHTMRGCNLLQQNGRLRSTQHPPSHSPDHAHNSAG
jgi:hypothetical protein